MPASIPLWRQPAARFYIAQALLWLIAVGVLALAWRVLLPFVLAALVAYVIDPAVGAVSRVRLGRIRIPRWAAVLVVYLAIAALLWLGAVAIMPQIYREVVRGLAALRDFIAAFTPEQAEAWSRRVNEVLQRYHIPVDVLGEEPPGAAVSVDLAAALADAIRSASQFLHEHLGDVVGLSRALVAFTLRTVVFVILLLMLTAFIAMDVPRILRFFESLVPSAWRPGFRRLLAGIDAGLSGVVRGQLTIMAINGALTLVGLLVLRIPFAFALAALATVLYVVPIFGTIISSFPIVLLALGQGFSRGLLALAWILGIHALETYVLNPRIMGRATRIHPVLIVLALVIGESYFGIVGALLAVPVASVVATIFESIHRKAAELDAKLASGAAGIGAAARPAKPSSTAVPPPTVS